MSANNDDILGKPEEYYLQMSRWYQAGYSLGLIGSLAVLLTGVMFWNDMVKNKIYMKLLMAVSLCDALASVMGLFGFGSISSEVCRAQGVMWYLFNRASWMFTVCITVTLFTQVTFGKMYVQFNGLTLMVTFVSIILIILPLVTTDTMAYGGENNCDFNIGQLVDSREITGGVTVESSRLFHHWFVAMFIIPLGIVCTVTLCLVLYMHYVVHHRFLGLSDDSAGHLMQSINSVLYYPLILIVFWGPTIINFFLMGNLADKSHWTHGEAIKRVLGTYVWSSIYPVGIAVYYFYKSEEARMRWRDKLGLPAARVQVADFPVDEDVPRPAGGNNSTLANLTNPILANVSAEDEEVL